MEKPQVNVKAVFDRALEIASPAERAAYLDQACAENTRHASAFFTSPYIGVTIPAVRRLLA